MVIVRTTIYIPKGKEDLIEKAQEAQEEGNLSATVVRALEEYIDKYSEKSKAERQLDFLSAQYEDYQKQLKRTKDALEDIELRVEKLVTQIQKENDGKLPVQNNLLEAEDVRHLLDQIERERVEHGRTGPIPLMEDEKVKNDNK